MKLKALRSTYLTELISIYAEDEIHAIFLLVIEHYLNVNRSFYPLKKEEEVAEENVKLIYSVLEELRIGKPIQYVLGETLFYGLRFNVNEAVLIPRPETEELVAWVIEKVNSFQLSVDSSQPISLLDIGTGSGCIAISLKKSLPQLAVSALDISSEALAVAKQNSLLNAVEITFFQDDILTSHLSNLISHISVPNTQYSILISNPPYITQNEKEQMHQNVLANEPHLALFVSNERPLIFYEAIADFALKNLAKNGFLFFEINEYLGEETVDMLSNKGFNTIELKKDMQGKNRMICCRLA